MSLIIIVGIKRKADKAPAAENLYTGFDADAGHEAAEEAADTGEFSDIKRYTNPSGSRLRVEPHHEVYAAQEKAKAEAAKASAKKQAETKAAMKEKSAKAKAEAADLAKKNQAAADASLKQKQAAQQKDADEFVAGRKAAKPPKAAEEKPAKSETTEAGE
jgi:hypothetical protein